MNSKQPTNQPPRKTGWLSEKDNGDYYSLEDSSQNIIEKSVDFFLNKIVFEAADVLNGYVVNVT